MFDFERDRTRNDYNIHKPGEITKKNDIMLMEVKWGQINFIQIAYSLI